MFHTSWSLYDPSSERSCPQGQDEGVRRRATMRRKEVLRRFPIGTSVVKPLGDGKERQDD